MPTPLTIVAEFVAWQCDHNLCRIRHNKGTCNAHHWFLDDMYSSQTRNYFVDEMVHCLGYAGLAHIYNSKRIIYNSKIIKKDLHNSF